MARGGLAPLLHGKPAFIRSRLPLNLHPCPPARSPRFIIYLLAIASPWRNFMANPEIQPALDAIGFQAGPR